MADKMPSSDFMHALLAHTFATEREPDIVPHNSMTESEIQSILERYINRDTTDSPWSDLARSMMGKGPATLNDREWIASQTWERLPNGVIRISK